MDSLKKMQELVCKLNEAAKAYYQEDKEIMSNYDYDKMYDSLVDLEKETGITLANSPTVSVGYEVISQLPKERHSQKMLSLDKTKSVDTLESWLKDKEGILSWKLDGLTIVLTYDEGELKKAVTRGNGEIGEVITNNAKVFKNIPIKIPEKELLTIRGEAIIKYTDFNQINASLEDEAKYKNPRNLCSGTVRQLNNAITAKRNVHFYGFQLVNTTNQLFNTKADQLKYLKSLGFEVVEYQLVNKNTVKDTVNDFKEKILQNDFASDGLVLTFNSIEYAKSLGSTSKFPKDSIAFKWEDEVKETLLIDIEWSASRTGLINPVAIFKPVDLEGTTVSRASVHNLSIIEELELGINDSIKVYKANMIIPQIADNITRSNNLDIPEKCPVCTEATEIKQVKDVKVLYCTNHACPAKKMKGFVHFASRNAMNIEGLSEATIKKFIEQKFLVNLADIYKLYEHKEAIIELEGFGNKSYERLMQAIESSKKVYLANFIYGLGILNVGLSNARLLCQQYKDNLAAIMDVTADELVAIDGFGEVIAKAVSDFFRDDHNRSEVLALCSYIQFIQQEQVSHHDAIAGKTFVITGSLIRYENRKALKEKILQSGGKVTGSVSSKTDFLINNDLESSSSKNKKAKELNIPIISEKIFDEML